VKEEEGEDVSSHWMIENKEKILETERGSNRSHCVENWNLDEPAVDSS